jgi:hypothetical protein
LVIWNDAASQATMMRLKLENLDKTILGRKFPEGVITASGNTVHFSSLGAERVLQHVDELVAETRKRRNLKNRRC